MLIPWTADVWLDRYPWATIGLIVANSALYFAVGMGSDVGVAAWSVEFGTGLHPLQWITSIFMHANIIHLAGNMLFLWVFGMIVEAKLSWWKFLGAYLALGVSVSAVGQIAFSFGEGRAVGASAAIYALLGMALIWAPDTDVECHWIVGRMGYMRWSEIEISVVWLAIAFVGLDAFAAWRIGFRPNSAAAHTLGALFGISLGVAFLKLRWVDCDGRDLFSALTGSYMKMNADRRRSSKPAILNQSHGRAASSALEDAFVQQHIETGQVSAKRLALDFGRATRTPHRLLSESELVQHAERLCTEGFQIEAVPLLEEYLRRFETKKDIVRLKLAELAINVQQRPQYGLRVLGELPAGPLKPRYEKLRQALAEKARTMIADGILELSGRAW
jgi:membrane associated rhomboid family serine protease